MILKQRWKQIGCKEFFFPWACTPPAHFHFGNQQSWVNVPSFSTHLNQQFCHILINHNPHIMISSCKSPNSIIQSYSSVFHKSWILNGDCSPLFIINVQAPFCHFLTAPGILIGCRPWEREREGVIISTSSLCSQCCEGQDKDKVLWNLFIPAKTHTHLCDVRNICCVITYQCWSGQCSWRGGFPWNR